MQVRHHLRNFSYINNNSNCMKKINVILMLAFTAEYGDQEHCCINIFGRADM